MHQARLNRVVVREGKVFADPLRKLTGRGAYVCSSVQCLKEAVRSGAFARAFRTKNPKVESMDLAADFVEGLRRQQERWKRVEGLSSNRISDSDEIEALLFRLRNWESEIEHERGDDDGCQNVSRHVT